jgi:uncharacterized protein (DUF433 family)
MKAETKRQNFNVSIEQEAEIEALQRALDASSAKDAILRAVRIVNCLAKELTPGKTLFACAGTTEGTIPNSVRIILADLERADDVPYSFLVSRPHAWRKQLCLKGHRALPSRIYTDMRANNMTPEDVARNLDIPLEAVVEIIRYCEVNAGLIEAELAEEWRRLEEWESGKAVANARQAA